MGGIFFLHLLFENFPKFATGLWIFHLKLGHVFSQRSIDVVLAFTASIKYGCKIYVLVFNALSILFLLGEIRLTTHIFYVRCVLFESCLIHPLQISSLLETNVLIIECRVVVTREIAVASDNTRIVICLELWVLNLSQDLLSFWAGHHAVRSLQRGTCMLI